MSVHEILPGRRLREIRRSDGGAFGGNLVDAAFFSLLDDIFGVNVMIHIKETDFGVIINLKNIFQTKKHTYKPMQNGKSETIKIDLPVLELKETIKLLEDECSFEDKINAAKIRYEGKISFLNKKKLLIESSIMEGFFEKAIEGVVNFINDIRKDDELNEINMIMLVGGLSSSHYVQKCIKERVSGSRIFVPFDPSLAVLKGAVIMGHKPKSIYEKIARYTYGLSVMSEFREGIDPERYRILKNGKYMCDNRFSKIVAKGTIYKPGEEFGDTLLKHEVNNKEERFATLTTSVYRTEDTNPEYAAEEYGCEVGAKIMMPPTNGGWSSITKFKPKMVLGLSELTVNVLGSNNETFEAKLEFL